MTQNNTTAAPTITIPFEQKAMRDLCRTLGIETGGTESGLRARLERYVAAQKAAAPAPAAKVTPPAAPAAPKVVTPPAAPKVTPPAAAPAKLTAAALTSFAGHVQAALTVLYGCGVALNADKDFGTVAAALEEFKNAALNRAKATTAAAPAVKVTPVVKVTAPAAAQTVKVEAAKVTPPAAPVTAKTVAPAAPVTPPAAPSKKAAAVPTTYKGVVSLGKDGVASLAKQLGVKADGVAFGVLCGNVWAKVKPQAAAPKCEAFKAGTVVVADGKGGFAVATEAQLWAALEQMSKSAK